ncbi:MAG: T9SS type A sorting domain-containing protein [Bacteroidales bacterium]
MLGKKTLFEGTELIFHDQELQMHIQVSDFSGRMQLSITSDDGRINLSGINDGMYVIRVTSGSSSYAALFAKIS